MRILHSALLIAVTIATAQAEPRKREKHEHHNYIIERQQAGLVSGVPTIRRIRGSREIDIYPDGKMFEKNNLVGIDKH